MDIEWDNVNNKIEKLSFNGEMKEGKVVSVYDGDTINVVFPLNNKLYKWNCRLNGIDTPEIRTRSKIEKNYGKMVRDKLRDKILNKIVKIYCYKFDKYGRLLVDIKFENININKWLINNKFAFIYNGGSKKDWNEYLLNKSNLE